MSQRIQTNRAKRRRGFTYLWIACLAALIFILIYKEWTEVLYILATVGVTTLLVLVAVADIGRAAPSSGGPAELADAQATGSGVSSKVSAQKPSGASNK